MLVIDVQNDYFPGGAWPLEGAEEATAEIVGAVRQAYKEGWMVVGIQDVAAPDAPFLRPGSPGMDILSAVAGAFSSQVRGMRVHVLAKRCAAPTRELSALALSGLQTRCRVK
ncbi:Isochorismatase family protein [compost metagenome]